MQVSEIMQRQIVTVGPNTPLQSVGKFIFGMQIAGIPVVKGKKLVGLITQTDILHKLYPTYQEFMEDYVHAKDFEAMEEVASKILTLKAGEIMNKNVTTVGPDVQVMKVQSMMLVKGFGRVPVIDKRGNLLGIVSQGDIFRAVVGEKLSFEQDELFHDWFSRYYGLQTDWKRRLALEIPDLAALFKKEGVTKVLDIGSGLAMQPIALAQEGFETVGIERSARMVYMANQKIRSLKENVRDRARVVCHEYKSLSKAVGNGFDAITFMGGGLAHTANPTKVFSEVNKVLKKKAVIVVQNPNFDKVVKRRLLDFFVRPSHETYEHEHAFLRFYDPVESGSITYNVAIFDRDKRWAFRGMHSTQLVLLDVQKTKALMRKIGFTEFEIYGGDGGFYYDHLFRKPFNPETSDQVIIVGKRS